MLKSILIALFLPLAALAGTSGDVGSVSQSQVGQPNGVASLDSTGKVPSSQIPGGGGGSTAWGSITGVLSSQTDLNTALGGKQNALTVGGSSQYVRGDLTNQTLDTSVVPENGNLYYTSARFNTAFGGKTTDALSEGSTNLYYTNARASAAAPVQSVFGRTGTVAATSGDYNTSQVTENTNLYYTQARFDSAFGAKSTTNLTEGTNLYYTNARAQAAVSALLPLVDTSGVFSLNGFTGDSGSGGLAGGVPAPATGSAEQGQVLGAGGGFITPDTSKPNNAPFQFLQSAPSTSGNQKHLNALLVQNGGNTYAVVGGGTTKTVTIYNVTNQSSPQLRGSITIAGTYGVCGSNASWPYVYVPASGGRTLTVLNISNPNSPVVTGTYSWAANTTSICGCAYYNGLVFMAGQSRGLGILDVGNGVSGGTPAAPVLAFDEGGTAECSVANSCKSFGVAVDGANSIAYVTTFSTATPWTYRELKAYSYASSITAPTLLQDLAMPSGAKPLSVTLNLGTKTAFVTDANATVIDVVDLTNVSTGGMSNLSTMAPTGGRTFNSELAAIAASGSNYVYIPGGGNSVQGGLDMYDLTNRSAPKWVAAVLDPLANNVFGSGAIDPRGGYIFIGSYGTGSAGSALDVFSTPYESAVMGSLTVENLTVKNTLTAPTVARTVATVSANTTMAAAITVDNILNMNTSGGALTLVLPNATTAAGFCVDVKELGTNAITVSAPSAQTIDGSSSDTINSNNETRHYCAVGGNWFNY